jgi:outer membrane immunogenic protein
MKYGFYAAAAAVALCACSAANAADFTGPRVGGTVGIAGDDFGGFSNGEFTYGVNAGYDFDLGTAVVGGTVEYQDSSEDFVGRDLSATFRAGAKAGENVLVYGLAGYTNLSANTSALIGTDIELDGFRVGAGLEVAVGPNAYIQLEERYSNYEADVDGWQTVVGVGFRF